MAVRGASIKTSGIEKTGWIELDIALVFANPMHQLLYPRFARFLLFWKMTREGAAKEGVPLPPQPSVMLMLMQDQLNDKNYLKWSQFVRAFLKGKGKLSHLLEMGLKPGDSTFAAWDEVDSMVMSWL
ncbi:hypothetical protein LWI29_013412 [Acer saccharum]|uniref:Retrotransposon Copia-like N-terminal domain-containing protein n=1 Tax=Acer saccharum TaxID=4024 RepID=A0AA39VDF7_ACESA|nr:hypothetical protein LWI29_013412 [Acer saccharum]